MKVWILEDDVQCVAGAQDTGLGGIRLEVRLIEPTEPGWQAVHVPKKEKP